MAQALVYIRRALFLAMFRGAFLFKQIINAILALLLSLPRLAALPSTAFFTEFQVSAPITPSLLHDVYQFVAELCLTVPGLPCGPHQNISLT